MGKLLYDAKLEWDHTTHDGNEHNNQIIVKGLDLESIAFLIDFYSWDNYIRIEISKGSKKIYHNHSNEEIGRSFIEDVEAVKDLLTESEVRKHTVNNLLHLMEEEINEFVDKSIKNVDTELLQRVINKEVEE